jgi:hypothetical protein
MNRRVWWVLRDYVGRTLGLWLLVLLAQIIQSVTFWAAGIPRIPLLAAVIAGLAYMALAEKHNSVLRTLPLTDTDGAVLRWWGTFGLPVVAMGVGIALAASLSAYKGRTDPSTLWLGTCIAISVAALASLSAIQRAFGPWGSTVWVALAVVAIIGLPMKALSAPILSLILVGSLCLSAAACLPVSQSVCMSQSSEERDGFFAWLRYRFSLRATGWTVMVFEVGRTTAIISVAAFIAATIIHRVIAPWTQTDLHGLVIWLVVSAIAVATGLSMRRWVEAVFSLRLLPITGRQLIFALYLAMILPGVLACVALSTARHFSPSWGLDIPGYMLVVFLPAPVTLIRWERPAGDGPHYLPQLSGPAIQQGVWPAWAGVFCSMCGLPFMPTWFFIYVAALAALFSLAAYRTLLARTRSPTALESHHSAMLESV